jgi:3-hydroxymyristoyl/3-hydroxydecanoyl-(acyl carrier protein) dehydratase
MSAQATARFAVPAEHPCLPGHFPGRPLVPGVVLLDHAFAAARREFGLGPARRVLRAKFAAPVAPGEAVALRLTRTGPLRVAFACDAFAGEAEFAAPAPPDGPAPS